MALSLLMFTGGSQFGLIGVVAGGGAPLAGAATAIMLGARNALYGLRLAELLQLRGVAPVRGRAAGDRRVDGHVDRPGLAAGGPARASTATGLGVFVLWNLGTLVGVLGAAWLSDPRVLGLDAAAPAAFLALLAPRLRGREAWAIALVAALVAVVAVPFVPVGFPVLIAALVGIVAGFLPGRTGPDGPTGVDEVVAGHRRPVR